MMNHGKATPIEKYRVSEHFAKHHEHLLEGFGSRSYVNHIKDKEIERALERELERDAERNKDKVERHNDDDEEENENERNPRKEEDDSDYEEEEYDCEWGCKEETEDDDFHGCWVFKNYTGDNSICLRLKDYVLNMPSSADSPLKCSACSALKFLKNFVL